MAGGHIRGQIKGEKQRDEDEEMKTRKGFFEQSFAGREKGLYLFKEENPNTRVFVMQLIIIMIIFLPTVRQIQACLDSPLINKI